MPRVSIVYLSEVYGSPVPCQENSILKTRSPAHCSRVQRVCWGAKKTRICQIFDDVDKTVIDFLGDEDDRTGLHGSPFTRDDDRAAAGDDVVNLVFQVRCLECLRLPAGRT